MWDGSPKAWRKKWNGCGSVSNPLKMIWHFQWSLTFLSGSGKKETLGFSLICHPSAVENPNRVVCSFHRTVCSLVHWGLLLFMRSSLKCQPQHFIRVDIWTLDHCNSLIFFLSCSFVPKKLILFIFGGDFLTWMIEHISRLFCCRFHAVFGPIVLLHYTIWTKLSGKIASTSTVDRCGIQRSSWSTQWL